MQNLPMICLFTINPQVIIWAVVAALNVVAIADAVGRNWK
jgi:hypothetical protein